MSPKTQLTIIGCGILGRAIVDGLLSGPSQDYSVAVTHRRADAARALQVDYPKVMVSTDNKDERIWSGSTSRHLVLIGAQPGYTADICREVSDAVARQKHKRQLTVITVCPGITVAQLASWLPAGTHIVRSMPNTPIAVGQGATAIFASATTPPEVVSEVLAILRLISPVVTKLPRENLMDVVASVSGSCPAYLFYLLQGIAAAGESLGLPADATRQLIAQSCLGAARLIQESPGTSLGDLLDHVCVPGGSTEKAIQTLDQHDTGPAVQAAVKAAWRANLEMGRETWLADMNDRSNRGAKEIPL